MSNSYEQNCPLCNNKATYERYDHGNYKNFKCKVCVSFGVSQDAEKILLESTQDFRKSFSKRTQLSSDEFIYEIKTCIPEVCKAGIAHLKLMGDFVERKSLSK